MRDLGRRVLLPENRPTWVPADTPSGVLADQFLHAYYYNRVRDGQNYPYRDLCKINSANREAAVQEAIEWWRTLTAAPSDEEIHITKWAPEVRKLLLPGNLKSMSESQFEELCLRVNAV